MTRRAAAAVAGISWLALSAPAFAQQAQAPMQERPTAAAQSSRRDAPDEPLQQSGPVVERRSTTGIRIPRTLSSDPEGVAETKPAPRSSSNRNAATHPRQTKSNVHLCVQGRLSPARQFACIRVHSRLNS